MSSINKVGLYMLQRSAKDVILHTRGFLISVECEPEVSDEHLENKIGEALMWMEGTGSVDVTPMGIIPEYEADDASRPTRS